MVRMHLGNRGSGGGGRENERERERGRVRWLELKWRSKEREGHGERSQGLEPCGYLVMLNAWREEHLVQIRFHAEPRPYVIEVRKKAGKKKPKVGPDQPSSPRSCGEPTGRTPVMGRGHHGKRTAAMRLGHVFCGVKRG